MDIQTLDTLENSLIDKMKCHPVLNNLETLTDDEFYKVLLQRRFLSLIFTPVYDVAIDGLVNEDAKDVSRKLLREEYPPSFTVS